MDQVKVFFLIVLALGITVPMTEGCSCSGSHLQDLFCQFPLVFRAKIIEQMINTPSQTYLGMKMIEYKIKLIKMFKGFNHADTFQYIYTHSQESLCGAKLDVKTQYLLTATVWRDGTVVVSLCGVVERWDNLLLAQKKNLKYRYQKGCECNISVCSKFSCPPISANECAWFPHSSQTLQGVCMKRTNDTCNWYIDKSDSQAQLNAGRNATGRSS